MGSSELFIILMIVLVLFGAKKIPELMGGLGKGIKSFKKGMNDPETPDEAKKIDPPTKDSNT